MFEELPKTEDNSLDAEELPKEALPPKENLPQKESLAPEDGVLRLWGHGFKDFSNVKFFLGRGELLSGSTRDLKDLFDNVRNLPIHIDKLRNVGGIFPYGPRISIQETKYSERFQNIPQSELGGICMDTYDFFLQLASFVPKNEAEKQYYEKYEDEILPAILVLAESFRTAHIRSYYTAYKRGIKIPDGESYWEFARQKPKSAEEGSVGRLWDAERVAIDVPDEDIEALVRSGSIEDKLGVLAELIDSHRHRTDPDAAPENAEKIARDQKQIEVILDSIPPSREKDLILISLFEYAQHRNIRNEHLKELVLRSLQSEFIKQALSEATSSPENWKQFVEQARESSGAVLEAQIKIEEDSGRGGRVEPVESFGVTVNVRPEVLIDILFGSRRILSSHEVGKSSSERVGLEAKRSVEDQFGMRSVENPTQPAPVYGAVAAGEIEQIVGAASPRDPLSKYGGIVIHIKPDVIRERTTFTFGDSYDEEKTRRVSDVTTGEISPHVGGFMVHTEVPMAKALYEKKRQRTTLRDWQQRHSYVEAQIHGGVEIEDIESIGLPYLVAAKEYRAMGSSIKRAYPSIDVYVFYKEGDFKNPEEEEKQRMDYESLGIRFVKVTP